MAERETGGVYHVFNRGVDHRATFEDDRDRERFTILLEHHRVPKAIAYSHLRRIRDRFVPDQERRTSPLVAIMGFCLMPNHFHLLLRQEAENGIGKYAQRFLNSYTRYYNTRHRRKGPLFEGPFRAVRIETDAQLLHVSRYIHLNPVVANLAEDTFSYPWSSAAAYCTSSHRPPTWKVGSMVHIDTGLLESMIPPAEYESFVRDHVAYARVLAEIKHLVLEEEASTPRPVRQPSRLETA